jgi:sulfur relay protein TusB/DsrH
MGEAKSTLFLVGRSPGAAQGLKTTLRLAKKGDAIAFIHDGVYFSQGAGRFEGALAETGKRGVSLHYLKADLEARGISACESVVDYDGLLDLIEGHGNVFS